MRRGLIAGVIILLVAGAVQADKAPLTDWRKDGSDTEKLENVVCAVPSASRITIEMGERCQNLYWTGKLGHWEFAEYQVEEMQSLVELLQLTGPARAATAQDFMDTAYEEFETVLEKQEWEPFYQSFDHMRQQRMICHGRNDHGFRGSAQASGHDLAPGA